MNTLQLHQQVNLSSRNKLKCTLWWQTCESNTCRKNYDFIRKLNVNLFIQHNSPFRKREGIFHRLDLLADKVPPFHKFIYTYNHFSYLSKAFRTGLTFAPRIKQDDYFLRVLVTELCLFVCTRHLGLSFHIKLISTHNGIRWRYYLKAHIFSVVLCDFYWPCAVCIIFGLTHWYPDDGSFAFLRSVTWKMEKRNL